MPLWFNKALNLTEEEVRYVMEHTKSNTAAAKFLGIHYDTWKRYAERYFDEESGQSLFELHKNQAGKGVHKLHRGTGFQRKDIFEILEGKHPSYNRDKLATRLIEEMIFPEKCNNCGFDERRITDMKVPLLLVHLDGDISNHKQENLEFLCYNCYFLTYDELFHKESRVGFKGF